MCRWRPRPMLTQIMRKRSEVRGRVVSGRVGQLSEPRSRGLADSLTSIVLHRDSAESNPLELPVEFVPGKDQRRRPAVGAVVVVLGQVRAGPSRASISSGGQPVAALIAALQAIMCSSSSSRSRRSGCLPAGEQLLDQVRSTSAGAEVGQHRRIARHQHRVAAERLDLDAQLRQQLAMLQHGGRLAGGQVDRLGHQQLCDSTAPASTFSRSCRTGSARAGRAGRSPPARRRFRSPDSGCEPAARVRRRACGAGCDCRGSMRCGQSRPHQQATSVHCGVGAARMRRNCSGVDAMNAAADDAAPASKVASPTVAVAGRGAQAAAWPSRHKSLAAGAGSRRFRRRRPQRVRAERQRPRATRSVDKKLRPQRAQQLAVEPPAVLEADFELRGMHVDVDHLGGIVEPQKAIG